MRFTKRFVISIIKISIRVHDAVSDSGVCTVIEQFVSGATLEIFCERTHPDDDIIIDIMLQICSGLSVLHQNNIVHRDITPTNIMIDDYGTVKIIEFHIKGPAARRWGLTLLLLCYTMDIKGFSWK